MEFEVEKIEMDLKLMKAIGVNITAKDIKLLEAVIDFIIL